MEPGYHGDRAGEGTQLHTSPKQSRETTPTKWTEAGWDEEGGLEQWYKEEGECFNTSYNSNLSVRSSHSDKGPVNTCPILKSVNFSKSAEFVEIWDDQFDFCVKEDNLPNPEDFDINSSPSRRKSHSRNKAKEVFNKSKDYIRSKVESCRKKLNASSLNIFSPVHRGKHGRFVNNCCQANISHPEVKQILEQPSNHDDHDQVLMNTTADSSCPNVTEYSDKFDLMVNDISHKTGAGNDTSSCRPLQVPQDNVREVCVTLETEESLSTSNPEELQHADTMPGLIRSQTDAEVDYGGRPSIAVEFVDDNDIAINMDQRSAEMMEDNNVNEEDIPMGTEANSFDQKERNFVTVLPPVMDKRLQWLLDTPQNLSFQSDLSQNTTTSMSSDISLDMLLNNRNEDPEDILMGLGFGDKVEVEDTIQRIPERFLNEPSELGGIDISSLIKENPELSSLFQSYIDSQNNSTDLSVNGPNSSGAVDRSPHMNTTFCSVMNSMKFLHALQSPVSHMQSNYNDVENDGVHSILNPENRDWLASQGYYHSKSVTAMSTSKPATTSAHKLFKSWSMDATERRKAFGKTRRSQHRSLSDLKEEVDELTSPMAENRTGTQSFDSFGNFTSVETSTDSFDSVDSTQFGRLDVTGSRTVGVSGRRESGIILPVPLPMAEDRAITNLRKQEMERMTSFPDADGDYFVSPPLSAQSSLENILTSKQFHKLSTRSSTCTLLGDTDSEPISDDLTSAELTNRDSDNTFIDNEPQESVTDSDPSHTKSKNMDLENSQTSHAKSNDLDMDVIKDVLTVYFTSSSAKRTEADGSTPGDELEQVFVCDRGQQTDKLPENGAFTIKVVDGSRQTYEAYDGTDSKANLEVLGRMESVQSDSSGFAEGDHIDMQEKVSNMGSSAESDQTNQSSATVLHDVPDRPRSPSFWSTNDKPRQVFVVPSHKRAVRKDASISTDDTFVSSDSTLGFEKSPTVQHDQCDSGNETLSDKSVVLTIELPREWIRSGQLSGADKGVISLSYQDHASQISPNMDTVGQDLNRSYGSITSIASVNPLESTPFKRPLRPEWASTPNQRENQHDYLAHQHNITTKHRSRSSKISSSNESFYMPYKRQFDSDADGERHCRFADSVNSSLDGSVTSVADESLEYVKLKQLVNKPVTFQQETRGSIPVTKYQPKHPIKTWPSIQQRLLLQEETQLVQYALHRYKMELNILETTFLVNKQLAWDELTPDEKTELDELQHLWTEVRKEVTEMEQYLANRMAATQVGNDRFQPLLVLEVVHKMVNLLREQMYQQEIYKSKINLELDPPFQPSQQVPWWPEVSQMLWDIKQRVSEPPAMSSASSLASGSMQDLRQIIREEVQQECRDSQRWLQKELEAKEKELCQLRKEVISNSIKEGQTKVRKYYESVV